MKVLLVNTPYTYHKTHPLSVAYLKSHLNEIGVECDILDLNFEFYNGEQYNKLSSNQVRYDEVKNDNTRKYRFKTLVEKHIELFKQYDLIGFSLFIDICEIFFLEAISIIKPHLKDTRVIVGGNYIRYADTSEIEKVIPRTDICFGSGMEFFDGEVIPYSYNQYIISKEYKNIEVLFSTGCINSCPFCYNAERSRNSIFLRDPDYIIKELLSIEQDLTLLRADNLVNSPKHFNEFVTKLSELNNNKLWYGQFALTKFEKHRDSILWDKIKPSKCAYLMLGIESFAENVRNKLKSNKFTNEDIIAHLNIFEKYNIKCHFHIILGYITETDEDFQQHLEVSDYIFERYKNIILNVSVNPYRLYFEDTKQFNIQFDENGNWIYNNNTITSRINRLREFQALVEKHHIRYIEVDIHYTNSLEPR